VAGPNVPLQALRPQASGSFRGKIYGFEEDCAYTPSTRGVTAPKHLGGPIRTFGACKCNVEHLEVARKNCEGELGFHKHKVSARGG
jgi:hypothetical protein